MTSTRRSVIQYFGSAVIVSMIGIALAQSQSEPPVPDLPTTNTSPKYLGRSGVVDLEKRLAGLDPTKPEQYLALGEEVAYELPYTEGQRLAKTLFVLAFELDRSRERPGSSAKVARSACIALADLSTRPAERRWLLAMASIERGGPARPFDWRSDLAAEGADNAPFELAEAIGHYRAEENRRARDVFERADVVDLLRRVGYDKPTAERMIASLRAAVESRVGCDRCRNERVIRKPGDGKPILDLCPQCRGNPGPKLNADQYIETLRAEAALLRSAPESWAASALLDGGQPLRDVEPGELVVWFGVDPHATKWTPPPDAKNDGEDWRRGRWVNPNPATQPAQNATTPTPNASTSS